MRQLRHPVMCNKSFAYYSFTYIHTYMHTKVSFFWDLSQDMSSSGFPPKNKASDWLTYLVWFFWLETTWTHVLNRISEKTDFSDSLTDITYRLNNRILVMITWNSLTYMYLQKLDFFKKILHHLNKWTPIKTQYMPPRLISEPYI